METFILFSSPFGIEVVIIITSSIKQAYATFQDIQNSYISDCEAAEVKSLGKTRLRSNLKRLCDLGIVEMGKEGMGKTGRLVFSIPDVPVEAVVEWVEGGAFKKVNNEVSI